MSVSSMQNSDKINETINKSAVGVGTSIKNMTSGSIQVNEVPQVLYGPAPPSPNDMVEELNLDLDAGNIDVDKANAIIEEYKGKEISSLTNEEFLEVVSAYAQIEYLETGILPSIVIALAINESNWGNNCEGNNLFGLKANDSWEGKTLSVPVTETNSNGEAIKRREDYKYYDSLDQGIKDYYELLKGERYKPFVEACKQNDVTGACKTLKDCGYATNQNFERGILEIMIDNNLGQYNP